MSEEYENLDPSIMRQNSKNLHNFVCWQEKKVPQVHDVMYHNADNLEMILGRASNIRVDDAMQNQKNF